MYSSCPLDLNNCCGNNAKVTFAADVTEIGIGAFTYAGGGPAPACPFLTNVIIPDHVTVLAADAFRANENLKSVVIGNGVTTVGASAFDGCRSLASVSFGTAVTTIGSDAFFSICHHLACPS
jgi:BspA type Leucine rich repeat region (6 copies)